MSDTNLKNTVYALKAFVKTKEKPTIEDFKENGYLLFKNEEKANAFLEICENLNQRELSVHYERYEHIQVIDYIYETVQKSSSFFIGNLKEYTLPTEATV